MKLRIEFKNKQKIEIEVKDIIINNNNIYCDKLKEYPFLSKFRYQLKEIEYAEISN